MRLAAHMKRFALLTVKFCGDAAKRSETCYSRPQALHWLQVNFTRAAHFSCRMAHVTEKTSSFDEVFSCVAQTDWQLKEMILHQRKQL